MKKIGVTLLELLIVVLIIGILATLAIPRFRGIQDKVVLAEAKMGLRALADAIEYYYIENEKYPTPSGQGNPIPEVDFDDPESMYWLYWTSYGGTEAACTAKDGKTYLDYWKLLIRLDLGGPTAGPKQYGTKKVGGDWVFHDEWPF